MALAWEFRSAVCIELKYSPKEKPAPWASAYRTPKSTGLVFAAPHEVPTGLPVEARAGVDSGVSALAW